MLFIRKPWEEIEDQGSEINGRQPGLSVWHDANSPVEVAGVKNLTMIYTGHPEINRKGEIGSAVIDPTLAVADTGWQRAQADINYYPAYHWLSPDARRTYLEWLSEGKNNVSYSLTYMFLYFYGLEHRYFADQPLPQERTLIIEEVSRLLGLYSHQKAARNYLTLFIEAATIQDGTGPAQDDPDTSPQKGISLKLLSRIGRKAGDRIPLDADDLLQWYASEPKYGLRQGDAAIYPVYRRMFTEIFNERYPGGMTVGTPQRTLSATYTAASKGFVKNLLGGETTVYDPRTLVKPLERAKEMADKTRTALTEYRNAMSTVKKGMPTPARAILLLPEEIADYGESPDLQAFHQWLEDKTKAGTPPTVEETAERLSGRHRNPIKEMFTVRKAMEASGKAWAPDPLISGHKPRIKETGATAPIPAVPAADKATLTAARRAAAALTATAHAGLPMDETVTGRVMEQAEAPPETRGSLEAHRRYLAANKPNASALRQTAETMAGNEETILAHTAAEAARAAPLTPPVEKALARVYTAFGADPETIHSDMHQAVSGRGRRTARPGPSDGVTLDQNMIARTAAETKGTAQLLAGIFKDSAEEETDQETTRTAQEAARLDPALRSLLEWLTTQNEVSQGDLQDKSRELGLMPGGATETLNELALEEAGDLIMENNDNGWDINTEAAATLLRAE